MMDRIGRYFARRGWAHLILLCGVGIFLFPFVWMVGMSMKTDDEAVSTQILPAIPVFRAQSPVVKPALLPVRPPGVAKGDWDARLPLLVDRCRADLKDSTLPAGADAVDDSALREAAAQSLAAATVERLPEKGWSLDRASFLAGVDDQLTSDVVGAALDDQMGRLEIFGLEVHSVDAQIHSIYRGSEIAAHWKVESGSAQLLPAGKDASYLRYHFNSANDTPIVLRADFDAGVTPDQFHKLVLSIKGDDSWHRLDVSLDLGGERFESSLTNYILQYRPYAITFQPPGFDDTTYRPQTWTSMKVVSNNQPSTPSTMATLRVTIRPSSTLDAIWGKVYRNYLRAFRSVPFWTYVGNSVLLVVLQMAGALLSAAFVAYAFARLQWPGRSIAFAILLGTMMLPNQVTMIPSFVIWRTLGWFNTLNPLWVPAWCGSAFFIFLMTQNMKTIPKELEEAARIDGLNPLQTWWYIILPLVKPTLAAIAIMVFMGAWNDFMGPLIMIRDQSRYPLSLGLFGMHVDQLTDSTLIMAGNMLMTLPVILIFFFFQRYFIEGVTVSGMKG